MEYSQHAEDQMKDRSITKLEVQQCLVGDYTRYADKKGNPIYRTRLSTGRGIKVVLAKDDPNFVITVADY